jgi:hypothetical protein
VDWKNALPVLVNDFTIKFFGGQPAWQHGLLGSILQSSATHWQAARVTMPLNSDTELDD